jgi:hypothetical protein
MLSLDRSVRYRPGGFEPEDGMVTLDGITQQPGVMGGKACIRGML